MIDVRAYDEHLRRLSWFDAARSHDEYSLVSVLAIADPSLRKGFDMVWDFFPQPVFVEASLYICLSVCFSKYR
jgi:hypothetical protein